LEKDSHRKFKEQTVIKNNAAINDNEEEVKLKEVC